MNESNNLE